MSHSSQNIALVPNERKLKFERDINNINITRCRHKSHEIYLGKPLREKLANNRSVISLDQTLPSQPTSLLWPSEPSMLNSWHITMEYH
jgi:hypothetical protein